MVLNIRRNSIENNIKIFRNGATLDATTHPKSMAKLVAKNVGKIIKHHGSPKGKFMHFHNTVITKQGFAGWEREQENQ